MLAQQSYYQQSATPVREFYSPQSVQMGSVTVHEPTPAILPQNTSPINMSHPQLPQHHHSHPQQQQHQQHHQHHPQHHPQHHQQQHQHQQQQQYMQMMQQRYDPNQRTDYVPPAYSHNQANFPGQQMPTAQAMMFSYHPNDAYKSPGPRILNQPPGTDWGFLGVG